MTERRVGQLSFVDDFVVDASRSNSMLVRVSELVDWEAVEALLSGLRSGTMGAPAYPALALFKALLLHQWYGLADPGLEEALVDRFSFRIFSACRSAIACLITRRCGVSANNSARAAWRSAPSR